MQVVAIYISMRSAQPGVLSRRNPVLLQSMLCDAVIPIRCRRRRRLNDCPVVDVEAAIVVQI